MSAYATNRSAALAGAWSGAGVVAYTLIADHLFAFHDVVFWCANVLAISAVSIVPYFKWVIGVKLQRHTHGPSFREQWSASQELLARTGIWLMSACAVGATLGIIARVFPR